MSETANVTGIEHMEHDGPESLRRAYNTHGKELEAAYHAFLIAGMFGYEAERRAAVMSSSDVGQALVEQFGSHVPLEWWMRVGGKA